MDTKKQKVLIENLISDPDVFAICQGIVNPEYFDPEYKNTVQFIKHYYDEYHNTPEPNVISGETGVELEKRNITADVFEYTTNEIEQFCKQRAIEKAILASPPLIEKGDYGAVEQKIRDAIMVSLNKDLGVRYYEDVQSRLERMLKSNHVEPTGWNRLDQLLFGGIGRKELLLLAASSGGGKSITLANLTLNFASRGQNVLYISLELSEDVVAQRFDTMHTGISRRDWQSHVSEIVTRVESVKDSNGVIDIKQMKSGTCANDIRAYLKEYYLHYKIVPDLIVVDYLDKMSPNGKVALDDVWNKDKLCTEQTRDIGIDYNAVIATASQLNRDAVSATDHHHGHIAGGISKINESDVFIIVKMNEAMKASGEIMFDLQKTRNSDGVGEHIFMEWDNRYLRIRDVESDDKIVFNKRNAEDSRRNDSGLMNFINDLDEIG